MVRNVTLARLTGAPQVGEPKSVTITLLGDHAETARQGILNGWGITRAWDVEDGKTVLEVKRDEPFSRGESLDLLF